MNLKAFTKFLFYTKFSLILVAILINILSSVLTFAGEYQTNIIRVGCINDHDFYPANEIVEYSSYCHEYFQKISKYTNWKYEFFTGSLNEIVSMLEKGDLDIIAPVQKTSSLSNKFNYSDMDFLKSYATLNVSENSNIAYNNFSSFNGLKVGMLKDSNISDDFLVFQQANKFSVIPFLYNSNSELSIALKDNKIDAVMSLNLRFPREEKIVARLFPVNYFIAVSKNNNRILESLNSALKKLKLDEPYFDSDIHKKYFPHISSNIISFTKEELEYIKNSKRIRTVYDPDWFPTEYMDNKTKSISGVTEHIFKLISKNSQLEFEFLNTKNLDQSIEKIKDGSAHIISGVLTTNSQPSDIILTDSYFNVPFVIIGQKNSTLNDSTVIVFSEKYKSIEKLVKQRYPNQTLKTYKTLDDCFYAIKNNKNFVLLENSFIVNQILLSLDDYGMDYISSTFFGMHIGVSDKCDPLLISILNKSIMQITEFDRSKITTNINSNNSYKLPFSSVIKMYIKSIITSLSIFFVILFAIIIVIWKRNYLRLKMTAYTDSLTGGRNLAKFKLDAYQLFKKYGADGYSILYIDIDKFKYINDMFGYQEGDKTLKYVYNVLISNLNKNEICARVSADWFAVLMRNSSRMTTIDRIQKIFNQISQFELLDVEHYELILKCGIYVVESHEKDINKMLNKAIITRETVRGGHKSMYAFYTDKIMEQIIKEKELENGMMTALNNNEFIIYMQPKYSLKSRAIVGAEALVRWSHPLKGLIPPMDFIPFFEKNGFIVSLDLYVFETVCKQIRWWLDNGYQPLPISVNISRVNLHQSEFVDNYISMVHTYNIPPELLELELTESAIFENQDLLFTIANKFKAAGISLSIDDFGTGYSCLSLLGIIPFDTIKIDRKFLTGNYQTQCGKIVISKIIELAISLELTVVSEGVETTEQEEFLKKIGCDMAQGYLFAHPMPIENFNNLIA